MIDKLISAVEPIIKIPTPIASTSPVSATVIGMLASIGTWALEAVRWYADNMPYITQWIIHIVQIGGVVIMVYSILILRRNWRTGRDNIKVIKNE